MCDPMPVPLALLARCACVCGLLSVCPGSCQLSVRCRLVVKFGEAPQLQWPIESEWRNGVLRGTTGGAVWRGPWILEECGRFAAARDAALMSPQEFSNMGAYISYQPIIKYGYGHMGHVYIEHRAMIEPRLPTIAHTYRQDRAQSRAPPASATVQRKLYS